MIGPLYADDLQQHIYKISPENEHVYAIHVKDKKHYNDLLLGSENSAFVRVFSFNDNVLEAIKESGAGDNIQPALFCNESGIGGKESISNVVPIGNTGFSFWCYNDFSRYGIYFSLSAWVRSSAPQGSYRFYIQIENLWYHVRCGNTVGPYSHPWYQNGSSTDFKHKYQSYSGSKNLNGVHLKTRGRCEIPNAPQGNNPYTTIFTEWNRIQQNNPYFP